MKALTFLVVFILMLFSCKKEGSNTMDPIVGKWKLEKFMAYSGKDGSILEEEPANECSAESYYEFLVDHTGKENSALGSKESDCEQWQRTIKKYSYEPSSHILKITFDNFEAEYAVYELTEDRLEIESAREDSDIDSDGVEDRFSNIYRK